MSKNTSKRCIYDCTVSGKITDLYGEGQYCEEFDQISGIVGTPKIKEHSKGELTESYFNGEALHFYSVNIIDLFYHIIGNVLGRYTRTSVRENAKKTATTNLNQTTYENEDPMFNKDENISQEHLLQHFTTAVVVLNPVWDLGIQNMMLNTKTFGILDLPENLSMGMMCPCSRKFRRWRTSYYAKANFDYPIDEDKVGFKECQSGVFTDFIEFYKHLKKFESECYYHEALVDIINILYPVLYTMVIDGRRHKKLRSLKTKKKSWAKY